MSELNGSILSDLGDNPRRWLSNFDAQNPLRRPGGFTHRPLIVGGVYTHNYTLTDPEFVEEVEASKSGKLRGWFVSEITGIGVVNPRGVQVVPENPDYINKYWVDPDCWYYKNEEIIP